MLREWLHQAFSKCADSGSSANFGSHDKDNSSFGSRLGFPKP